MVELVIEADDLGLFASESVKYKCLWIASGLNEGLIWFCGVNMVVMMVVIVAVLH